ncbi:MAG: sigma-70 family RNA polymerase sigma factor [Clostridiales bacterium]|nr:sigma-70 family RNA polymerase sigma factor [Clostridiales bacterium]MCF8023065.1 sigma-70 family RNA polymerase sigma factor [Clostridiales bacterium]
MDLTDEQLVTRFKKGNVEAFEELVSRYEVKIYNLAYRFTGNYTDAGDLAQEAFIRVYRALSKFRGDSSFSTWMYRIASNVCRDELRKQRRKKSVSLEEMGPAGGELVVPDTARTPDEIAVSRDLQERIQKYLNELSPDYRLILVMREIQELSYEEIASILKCSMGTVKSRLSRARGALKNKIKANGELWS